MGEETIRTDDGTENAVKQTRLGSLAGRLGGHRAIGLLVLVGKLVAAVDLIVGATLIASIGDGHRGQLAGDCDICTRCGGDSGSQGGDGKGEAHNGGIAL